MKPTRTPQQVQERATTIAWTATDCAGRGLPASIVPGGLAGDPLPETSGGVSRIAADLLVPGSQGLREGGRNRSTNSIVIRSNHRPGSPRALMERQRRRRGLSLPLVALAKLALMAMGLAGSPGLQAGTFSITRAYFGGDGYPRVEFAGRPDAYYLLYQGSNVAEITLPTDVKLGAEGVLELADRSAPTASSTSFYRVREVSQSDPLDTDGDGIDDVWELRRPSLLHPLDAADAQTDPDHDGHTLLHDYLVATQPLTTVLASSPAQGADDVSVTRETILWFSRPLSPGTVLQRTNFFATFVQQPLLSRIELSADRRKATLFYLENLPGSARIRVSLDCANLQDDLGRVVDGDGDGTPGGTRIVEFDTLSQSALPGTVVFGRVFASELAVRSAGQTNLSVNVPLAGAIITADGLEETVRAVTDQNGNFRLENCPPGEFFVHIDGRPITNLVAGIRYPDLAYYPYVGKKWVAVPGAETSQGEIYLPLVQAGTLQPVSQSEETVVTFPPGVLDAFPELAGTILHVPPNALFSDNGTRGGRVGIAPVPPDRIPSPLPDGLQLPVVITVQTDGGSNFDTPVPVCFPNLDRLSPGRKSALWSFNHDTGRWEIIGPMTVSADGTTVCTDPGVGILFPGWHGTAPGSSNDGGDGSGTPGGSDPGLPENCFVVNTQSDCTTCSNEPGDHEADPIHFGTGEFHLETIDLRTRGVGLDFVWGRSYRSLSSNDKQPGIGYGWDFTYNISIDPPSYAGTIYWSASSGGGQSTINVHDSPDKALGLTLHYGASGRDDHFEYDPDLDVWTANGHVASLSKSTEGVYSIRFPDLTTWTFKPANENGADKIDRIEDRNGNALTFHYNEEHRLTHVEDTLGRTNVITWDRPYDPGGSPPWVITEVTDFAGRKVRYRYFVDADDPQGNQGNQGDLKSVTTPSVSGTPNGNDFSDGKTTSYTYLVDPLEVAPSPGYSLTLRDGGGGGGGAGTMVMPDVPESDVTSRDTRRHNLLTITDGRRNDPGDPTYGDGPFVINTYDGEKDRRYLGYDRVVSQNWGGQTVFISYSDADDANPGVDLPTTAVVRDRAQNYAVYDYDEAFRCVRVREYTGRPGLFAITDLRALAALKLRSDDPDYFETRYTYNADSQIASVTFPRGNSVEYVYEGDLTPDAHANARANLRYLRRNGVEEEFQYLGEGGGCCNTRFITYHKDGRGNVTHQTFDTKGNLLTRTHRLDSIVEAFKYDDRGRLVRRILPDNGSGHARMDAFAYDPVSGQLRQQVLDTVGFKLTTGYTRDAVGNLTSITDPRGGVTQLVQNSLDQVVQLILPSPTAGGLRYTNDFYYDANDNLVRVDRHNIGGDGAVEANRHFTTEFEYEMLDKVIRRTEEVGTARFIETEFAYDGNRNLTSIRLGEAVAARQPDNTISLAYDERDLLYQITRGPGSSRPSTTQRDYDGNRNLKALRTGIETSEPHVHLFEYDDWDRLSSLTDPAGNVTIRSYDNNHNLLGLSVYGELEDVAGSVNNILLRETRFAWDAMDRLTEQRRKFFNPADGIAIGDGWSTHAFGYNGLSQVVVITNDNGHQQLLAYDTANRLGSVTDAKGNQTIYGYNDNSSVIRLREVDVLDLGGTQEFDTGYQYDTIERLTRVVDNRGHTTRFEYDSRHNRVTKTDALGNLTRYAYDGLERLTETRYELRTGGTGAGGLIETIVNAQTWDDSSRLTAQIDGHGNATTYVYDALNRRVSTVMADGTADVVEYNGHGNPTSRTDANGTKVTLAYDALDRLVRKEIAPAPDVAATTTTETFAYDGLSRRIAAANDASAVTFAYDSLDHVVAETLRFAGSPDMVTTLCDYDGVGNLIRCVYPSGHAVTNAFDALERKFRITDGDGLVAEYAFAGRSRVQRRTYGNGVVSTYIWNGVTGLPNAAGDDGVKRISRITTTDGSGVDLDRRSFAWDAVGNKIRHTDERIPRTTTYAYDSIYRLTKSDRFPALGSLGTVTYAYDAVGNRTTVTGGSSAGSYTMQSISPPADQQVNQYTYSPEGRHLYDANGNLVSLYNSVDGRTRTFQYDYANRMVAFSDTATGVSASYAYDALGRRIRKSGPEDRKYFYRGWTSVDEVDLDAGTTQSFVRGHYIDEVLKTEQTSGAFYHTMDDLYSLSLLTDGGGLPGQRLTYEDFGKPVVIDGSGGMLPGETTSLNHAFTGRRFDRESGLQHYQTRYLDPSLGRFSSRDTIGAWGDQMGMGSPFTYVANGPLARLDPFGLAGDESPTIRAEKEATRSAMEAVPKRDSEILHQVIDAVASDAAFVKKLDSPFSGLGNWAGFARNMSYGFGDLFNLDEYDSDSDPYGAGRRQRTHTCEGIAIDAENLINSSGLPVYASRIDRGESLEGHVAVRVILDSGATYVLDWHQTLRPDSPRIQTVPDWCGDNCAQVIGN